MPRDANTGAYTAPSNSWNPATPDMVISSQDWNALRNDMTAALNHAPATTRALYPTTAQVQDGAFIWGGTAGGTADALTLTLTPPITAYTTGMVVRFIASADNISPTPTLAINGVDPAVIARRDGTTLAGGEIESEHIYEVLYSGTEWRLTSITARQLERNDGSQAISGSSVLELDDYPNAALFIEMNVENASVHLPDATRHDAGPAKFTIINNGNTDFFVRPSPKTLLQNGDFANMASWTLGSGWSIGSGVATKTPGDASDLSQPLTTEKYRTYVITFSVTTFSGGSVRVGLTGGGTDVWGTPRSAPGIYTEILTSNGNTTFVLRADAAFGGSIDNVGCRMHELPALALLRPKQIAAFSLLSNSTCQGVWSSHYDAPSPPQISAPGLAPSSIILIHPTACALNNYQVLHFGRNASNHLFAYVVDYKLNGVTVGTPTLVSTSTWPMRGAHLVESGKVLFCQYNTENTNGDFRLAIIDGTQVTISSAVQAHGFIDKRAPGPGPQRVQIGKTIIVSKLRLFAIDCSGTTPTSVTGPFLGTGTVDSIAIFSQPSNRVVCFYVDDTGTPGSPYSIRGRVATVSDTNFTLHTAGGINDVVSGNSYGAVEISPNLYLIAYMSSATQVSVVAATVSGTSVTFHTPVNFTVASGSTLTPNDSFENEMFQKLSDTEAVLIVSGVNTTLTFAHIKIDGTSLTVTTSTQPSGGTHCLITTRQKKIYYNFLSASLSHANRVVYSLSRRGDRLAFGRIPNMRAVQRPIKINQNGFIVPFVDVPTGPDDETNTRHVFVSTEAETEQVFPLFGGVAPSLRAEEITPQKAALYGPSLPSGQILHYLMEGVS